MVKVDGGGAGGWGGLSSVVKCDEGGLGVGCGAAAVSSKRERVSHTVLALGLH